MRRIRRDRAAGTSRRLGAVAGLVLGAGLAGCAEEPPPLVEPVRTVRTTVVSEPASGRLRRLSGIPYSLLFRIRPGTPLATGREEGPPVGTPSAARTA